MSKRYVAFYALGLILLGWLAYQANRFSCLPGDSAISSWFQDIDSPLFDLMMRAVSWLGDNPQTVITVLGLALLMAYFRRRLEAVFIIVLPAAAGLLNYLLKVMVDRPRPGDELLSGGLSFPSGHATYAVILFGFLCYLAPRLIKGRAAARAVQLGLVLLILFTGLARVYLGAHWPSDILGSFLFGGLLLAAAIPLYNNYARSKKLEDGNA